jgi:hypothetical protein
VREKVAGFGVAESLLVVLGESGETAAAGVVAADSGDDIRSRHHGTGDPQVGHFPRKMLTAANLASPRAR